MAKKSINHDELIEILEGLGFQTQIDELKKRDRESFKRLIELEDQVDKLAKENYELSKNVKSLMEWVSDYENN